MKNSSHNSGVETDMQEADMVSKRQAQLADNVNVAAAVTKSSAAAAKAKTYSSTELLTAAHHSQRRLQRSSFADL